MQNSHRDMKNRQSRLVGNVRIPAPEHPHPKPTLARAIDLARGQNPRPNANNSAQLKKPPVAPPPYRPQPIPRVLQTKSAIKGRLGGTAAAKQGPPNAPASQLKSHSLTANAADARAVQPRPGGARIQLQVAPRNSAARFGSRVIQLDPKYVKPVDYDKVAAPKDSGNYQYGKSQILPDTQSTYATAKLNGWYLAKYYSSGEHAEQSIVDHVKSLVDQGEKLLLPIGQKNKLSIHLNKSPCTSTSRGGKPATNTSLGCTERLIDLAKNGYKGHTFYIRLKIQNLYQPQIQGAKEASKLALQELEANGISVIGYNRDYKLEKASSGAESTRGEPLSPYNVADTGFEYSDTQKDLLEKQWESVSEAVGKKGVYKWANNS